MKQKTIGIIYNPISGKGRSRAVAEKLAARLRGDGYSVRVVESSRAYKPEELRSVFTDLAVLFISGGDGTLLTLLQPLAESGIPVYMLPTGNESLFARQFSMTADPDHALEVLKRERIAEHYIGRVNGRGFFTMVSAGLDSEVVFEICACRSGPVGHSGYLRPTFRRALAHRPPRFTLTVDGQLVLSDRAGYLIIANAPSYACSLPLVPEADSTQKKLHARFIPLRSKAAYIPVLLKLGLRAELRDSLLFSGERFELSTSPESFPLQADGEFIGMSPAVVEIQSLKLSVLS